MARELTGPVCLDYTPGPRHAPGVGRYVRELVRALVELPQRPPLVLAEFGREPRRLPPDSLGDIECPGVSSRTIRVPRRLLKHWPLWLRSAMAKRLDRPALFQRCFPGTPAPFGVPEVLPVATLPEPGSRAEGQWSRAAQGAAGVLVFSPAMREPVARRLGLPIERVHAVRVGADHWVRDLMGIEHLAPASQVAEQEHHQLVALGHPEGPARAEHVLEAASLLAQDGPALGLQELGLHWLGGEQPWPASLKEGTRGLRLRHSPRPAEALLATCVSRARVLVHLDETAGTPVTPLEAASLGVQPLVVESPIYREALGDLAEYVSPGADAHELASAMRQAFVRQADTGQVQRLRDLGARFTWRDCARETVAIWDRLLKGQQPMRD